MTEQGERKRMPVIWVLLGGRAGDNAQALAVAEELGQPVVLRRLRYNGFYRIPNLLLGAGLVSLEPQCRAELAPPWPDLVIGVGRRSVPVARWIEERSGGRARLVHIGRPRAPLSWFDLLISPPQYRLPDAPNVLRPVLPPIRNAAPAPEDIERCRPLFAHLPRPWIGVLVGGPRAPYRFDAAAALRLGREASEVAKRLGGSLLVSTSPRTGKAEAGVLTQALTATAFLGLWSPGADNPHQAILALADRFIVTGETVSMMAEACLTGKPVLIFELPRRWSPSWGGESGLGAVLARSGLVSPPRDVAMVRRLLVEHGHAAILGGPEPASFVPVPDERRRVVEAVRRLIYDANAHK